MSDGEMPGYETLPPDLPAALDRAVARLRAPLRVCTRPLPGGMVMAFVGLDDVVYARSDADALRQLAHRVAARLASQGDHDAALLAALDEAAR